jgi:hypothetical protein
MDQSHADVMMALAFAGLGLLASGLATLVFHKLAFRWRAGLALLAAGAATGGAVAWGGFEFAKLTAGALTVGEVAYLLLASSGVATLLARLARRPALPAAALCAAGLATVLGGFAWFDREDEIRINEDMSFLSLIDTHPPLYTPMDVYPQTDRGTSIPVKAPVEPRTVAESNTMERGMLASQRGVNLIRTSSPTDVANCHGWVFAGGRYWVEGSQVDTILSENGYAPVKSPQPGDLVIYRAETGVNHTGMVRYVADGQPVLVESKWGSMGVYLHRVSDSVYGTSFKYYRSPRTGHVLAGLDPTRSTEQAGSGTTTPAP